MAKQTVEVAPGESKEVSFEAVPHEAKTYQVEVNGLTGTFEAIGEALTYTCPYCLTPLYSLDEFFNHLESVHFYMLEDYFYCPYCPLNVPDFGTLRALFSHLEAEHMNDITAPPIPLPEYLHTLKLDPLIVKQGEDATITGYFIGPFPAYTSYRLAFNFLWYSRPRAYRKITSAGLFSMTLPTVSSGHRIYPAVNPITTSCAYRRDPPGGPIVEETIWLNIKTGLSLTVLPA